MYGFVVDLKSVIFLIGGIILLIPGGKIIYDYKSYTCGLGAVSIQLLPMIPDRTL